MYLQSKFFQLFFISAIFCIGSCSEDEERLVETLFTGYNKLIRPARNITEKVHVKFGLGFVQLINVNEREQIMKSNVWLRFEWFDYQLQWDEADYGDIKVLRLPPDKVWKPDIVLFNNADGNYEVRYKSNVLIHPNGAVLWVPPAIYQSSCTIDVTYFPFDQQTCVMKFSSWTFNGDQVSLSLYNNKHFVDLSDYGISGTWDIISVPAFLNVYRTENRPTETDITFHIVIRRKTIFYTVNLILPTVLISLLCVLEFYLPAEAREKITLGISILLSLVVFLLLVSKILPPTSLVVPLIAKYLLFTFIMNVSSILSAVVIINWNFRGPQTHRMPELLRTIFLKYLPKFLLMQRPKRTHVRCVRNLPSSIQPRNRQKPYCAIHNPIKETLEMVEFYQQNYHHDPRANNDYNQPSTSDISRHPNISGIVVQPSTSDVYWPSTSDTYNHPSTFDTYNQPSNSGVYIRPSTSGISRQPSTSDTYNHHSISGIVVQPSTSGTYNRSSTSDVYIRPSTSGISRQPSISDTYNRPSTSDVYIGPSTSDTYNQLSTSDTYNQPSTSGIIVQPSTSGTSQKSVEVVNSSEEDDSIFSCSKVLRAAKAIEFIAEHVRNEELYLQTREDWKFMAMVINRFQLYLFFIVTTFGTVTLMMHAPHIFEHVDQEKIKQIYYGK